MTDRAMHPLVVRLSRVLELVNAGARRARLSWMAPPVRLAAPVLSVGNLAIGGTGKTPLVAALATLLVERGARPAVLTRGYGRSDQAARLICNEAEVDWRLVGDEPALLARAVPGVRIAVDADRARGGRAALAAGATHLLLDDGFQHWRLARDVDIVLVAAADPLSRNGLRRERPSALGRATAVVVVGRDADDVERARPALHAWAPTARLVGVRVVPRALHQGDAAARPDSLAGRRVLAFAGIARPQRFLATLAELGAEIVGSELRNDHYPWPAAEVRELVGRAERDGLLPVTTGKDVVKLEAASRARCAWLEVGLDPVVGRLEELLGRFG